MKRKCKELKQISRGNLCSFYGTFILAMILASMIPSFILMPFNSALQNEVLAQSYQASTIITYFGATLLMTLITAILGAGQFKMHLSLARKLPVRIGDLFSQFTKRPDRFIVGTLIILFISIVIYIPFLIVFLLTFTSILHQVLDRGKVSSAFIIFILCLYLAGIILNIYISLRFSQFLILLVDHEEYSAIDALKTSWKLMSGNVGRYFYISLSFIGLTILGIFSFGIAFLWIQPYMTQTNVQFYLDITGQIDQRIADERRMDEEMGPLMEY